MLSSCRTTPNDDTRAKYNILAGGYVELQRKYDDLNTKYKILEVTHKWHEIDRISTKMYAKEVEGRYINLYGCYLINKAIIEAYNLSTFECMEGGLNQNEDIIH